MVNPILVNWQSDTIIAAIFGAAIAGLFVLANTMLTNYQEKKKKPDLDDDDYSDAIKHITDGIQSTVGAYRVNYWAAQNGEKTLDGFSIKKLSMMVESNDNGVDNIITEMQNIPAVAFKRTIDALRSVDSYVMTKEFQMNDSLSKMHRAYGVQVCYFFKVKNLKKNLWTGIIAINFEDKNAELGDSQIGWIELQAKRISGIISQL